MILLVTGSRDWPVPDKHLVMMLVSQHWTMNCPEGEPFIVRHGAARGVDSYASEWVHETRQHLGEDWMHLVDEDPHPVSKEEWRRSPRLAGYDRNLHMINMQPPPDYVLAFSYQNSGGTAHAWRQAHVIARIPGRIWTWEQFNGDSDGYGAGHVVAAGARAEQPARAPGDADGDRLF